MSEIVKSLYYQLNCCVCFTGELSYFGQVMDVYSHVFTGHVFTVKTASAQLIF